MSTENTQNNQGSKTNYESWMDKVVEGGKEREKEIKSREK